MGKVGIRELNQRTAEVIARVELGERIEITRNGTTVGIIEPVHPSPLAALLEAGELRPARSPLPTFDSATEFAEDSAGLDALIAEREDRDRW
jgi:prevent-host-death family protein